MLISLSTFFSKLLCRPHCRLPIALSASIASRTGPTALSTSAEICFDIIKTNNFASAGLDLLLQVFTLGQLAGSLLHCPV